MDHDLPRTHEEGIMVRYGLHDGLPETARRALRELGQPRRFAAGLTLFDQGAAADEIYGVDSGRIKLWRISEVGAVVVLNHAQRGNLVGLIAGVGDLTHVNSATTMTPVTATAWNAARFRELMRGEPRLGAIIASRVASQAVRLITRLEELTAAGVTERVARVLARLALQMGHDDGAGPIHVDLAQADVAELAHTTVPTLSRLLGRWRAAEIIASGRGTIAILDLPALVAIGRMQR